MYIPTNYKGTIVYKSAYQQLGYSLMAVGLAAVAG